MQNSGSPQLDLTGKLIIKVALGDDIRRIPIHNEDITYDELVLMMQRVYRGKLSTNDEVTIKYKDEDGDLITIFDSSDLSFAIQCSRILKITLFVGGSKSLRESSDMTGVRRELQDIRDRVIDLLDRLEPTPLVGATQGLSLAEGIAGKSEVVRQSPLPILSNGSKPVNSVGGKEFDPLKSQLSNESTQQNKLMASFGGSDAIAPPSVSASFDRTGAATPDSISSVGSSASNQVKAQHNMPQLGSDQQQHPQQQNLPSQLQQAPQQQHPPQQQPPQQQQQQPSAYSNQSAYGMTHPGQITQMYAGQPGYNTPQVPGQPSSQQATPQAPPQQPHAPPSSQQHQPPSSQPSQGYDSGMYNNYNNQGYPGSAGQPVPGQMMYGQPGMPNPYGQAPGMPQAPQPKNPGYSPGPPGPPGPQQPGVSPGNPYSRGAPTYSAGYPRPTAGYPQ